MSIQYGTVFRSEKFKYSGEMLIPNVDCCQAKYYHRNMTVLEINKKE